MPYILMRIKTASLMKLQGSDIKVNNIVKIPCDSIRSFFRFWLTFLKPFHSMTPRMLDVAACILYTRYVTSKKVQDSDLLDYSILRKSSRKMIADECGLPVSQLNVIIMKLRRSGFIIGNKINTKCIPNYSGGASFNLMMWFAIDNIMEEPSDGI